jgi:DHA2 family multidrug resistance protein
VVQILGLGLTTVPLSTIMFRFLPADQTSNASGIYALVRNEGGSIGIALSSTFLQRTMQAHQSYLGSHLNASNPAVVQAVQSLGASGGGNLSDSARAGLTLLYSQIQRQAALLAYMDQYRMFAYLLAAMLPLVFFLKRPPRIVGKIELEAH